MHKGTLLASAVTTLKPLISTQKHWRFTRTTSRRSSTAVSPTTSSASLMMLSAITQLPSRLTRRMHTPITIKASHLTGEATTNRLSSASAQLSRLSHVKLTSTITEALHSESYATLNQPFLIIQKQLNLMENISKHTTTELSAGTRQVNFLKLKPII